LRFGALIVWLMTGRPLQMGVIVATHTHCIYGIEKSVELHEELLFEVV